MARKKAGRTVIRIRPLSSSGPDTVKPLPVYGERIRSRRQRRRTWAILILVAFFCGAFFSLFPLQYLPILVVPMLALAAIAIWALPERSSAPTSLLRHLYFAFFIALVLWPNYLAIAIPGLPWITLLRVVAFPMAAVLLICLSVSSEFRAEIWQVLSSTPWILRLILAFVAIQFLTIPFSAAPFSSSSKFVVAQLNWTMVFFVSCYVFRSPRRVAQWAIVAIVMALFTVAIGIVEWRFEHVPWAGHIPSFLAIDDDAVARILAGAERTGGGAYRVQSTFTTSLSFAEYLALVTPFAIHFAVEGRRIIARAAAMLSVAILFFGIFITNARLGAIGFFLSLLLYIGVWGLRRWLSRRSSIFGPAITLGYPLIFASFIGASLVNLRLYRMIWGGGQYEFSTDARREQLEMALPKILHMPLGHGIGQAAQVLQFYSPGGLLTIDSYYLSIALDYGIWGFVIYYSMFSASILYGATAFFRSRTYGTSFLLPCVIALANFIVIKSVLSQEANHPLAFMLLGMIAALVYQVTVEGRQSAT